MMWKLATTLPFILGASMFAMGQAEPITNAFPYADLVLNGGALAVLAWAVWHAYTRTIPGQQKAFTETLNEMAARHERLESQRHEDSEKLVAGLHELSVTCTKTQTLAIQQAEKG